MLSNNSDCLPQENKRSGNDCGHNENEWGLKDISEDVEWEKHYHDRNKKWRFTDESENKEV